MYKGRQVLCIIPARGGSVGLPGKNIRLFGGLPMLAHNIGKARKLPEIDRLLVSTDSAEIAAVARQYGAEVPFLRDPSLAASDTPMAPVVVDAVERVIAAGAQVDIALMLQANSPLLRPSDILRVLDTLVDNDLDVVFTVAEASHPPQWSLCLDGGRPEFAFQGPESSIGFRRQDQETLYRSTGAVFAVAADYLLGNRERVRLCLPAEGQRSGVVVTDRLSAMDIDTEDDFRIAEAILQAGVCHHE